MLPLATFLLLRFLFIGLRMRFSLRGSNRFLTPSICRTITTLTYNSAMYLTTLDIPVPESIDVLATGLLASNWLIRFVLAMLVPCVPLAVGAIPFLRLFL